MMFVSLCMRMFCVILGIDSYIPSGFIFAFPSVVQIMGVVLPFMDTSNPLLIIRMAEALMGRLKTYKLTIVVPAHFLGCIIGAISFKTIVPLVPSAVMQPVVFSSEMSPIFFFMREILLVTLYVFFYLVVPDMLEVNKFSQYLLGAFILPLLLIGHGM